MISAVEALGRGKDLPLDQIAVTKKDVTDHLQGQLRHGVRVGSIGLLLPAETSSEIVVPQNICRLPSSPAFLVGVINVRGRLVPVFDMAQALDLDVEYREKVNYLVIDLESDSVAIVVDQVPERVTLDTHNKLDNLPTLSEALRTAVIDAYEVDGFLWIEWDVEESFVGRRQRQDYQN